MTSVQCLCHLLFRNKLMLLILEGDEDFPRERASEGQILSMKVYDKFAPRHSFNLHSKTACN